MGEALLPFRQRGVGKGPRCKSCLKQRPSMPKTATFLPGSMLRKGNNNFLLTSFSTTTTTIFLYFIYFIYLKYYYSVYIFYIIYLL